MMGGKGHRASRRTLGRNHLWRTPRGPTPTCQHDGGIGIGAMHTCYCIRPKDHPIDSERPHGCNCGALWADTCDPDIGYHTTPHTCGRRPL